jgi:hypothetical protein
MLSVSSSLEKSRPPPWEKRKTLTLLVLLILGEFRFIIFYIPVAMVQASGFISVLLPSTSFQGLHTGILLLNLTILHAYSTELMPASFFFGWKEKDGK